MLVDSRGIVVVAVAVGVLNVEEFDVDEELTIGV